MTPAEFRDARKRLGLSQHAMAEALRMGKSGWQSVGRWEKDGNTIPGPVQVATECLLRHGPTPATTLPASPNPAHYQTVAAT